MRAARDCPPRAPPLYSAAPVVASDVQLLRRLLSLGEQQLSQLAADILANPRVAEAFSRALQRAFETKGRVDKNMQALLAMLNLPSRADYARLQSKLEALQGSLVNLNLKVDRLLADKKPRTRRRNAGKPTTHAHGEAGD
jgi:hypothetical protein